jgi:hypothetical protein
LQGNPSICTQNQKGFKNVYEAPLYQQKGLNFSEAVQNIPEISVCQGWEIQAFCSLIFESFTALSMRNAVFWDVIWFSIPISERNLPFHQGG